MLWYAMVCGMGIGVECLQAQRIGFHYICLFGLQNPLFMIPLLVISEFIRYLHQFIKLALTVTEVLSLHQRYLYRYIIPPLLAVFSKFLSWWKPGSTTTSWLWTWCRMDWEPGNQLRLGCCGMEDLSELNRGRKLKLEVVHGSFGVKRYWKFVEVTVCLSGRWVVRLRDGKAGHAMLKSRPLSQGCPFSGNDVHAQKPTCFAG